MTPVVQVRRVRPRSLLAALLPLAVIALFWWRPEHPLRTALFAAVATALTVVRVRNESLLLRVDDGGVLLGPVGRSRSQVRVPWGSVAAVVVGVTRVGVLLLPEAPRPAGLRGLVRDPRRPDLLDPQLSREVPGLDAAAVRAAVRARGVAVRPG